MRPHLGHIEDIPSVIFSLLRGHNLHVNIPGRIVFPLDGFEEILDQKVGVFSRHADGFFFGEVLDALGGFDVEFDVFEGAILTQSYWVIIYL